ncbi:hypothetical protein AGDE_13891 [Angomonas deanei]|nr:hypothetical protein AGDE_13891 [Angomonas deanei]|eukprot:EPY21651.1 hypothetical protein AGDE_13891 [Angomonas deanei]
MLLANLSRAPRPRPSRIRCLRRSGNPEVPRAVPPLNNRKVQSNHQGPPSCQQRKVAENPGGARPLLGFFLEGGVPPVSHPLSPVCHRAACSFCPSEDIFGNFFVALLAGVLAGGVCVPMEPGARTESAFFSSDQRLKWGWWGVFPLRWRKGTSSIIRARMLPNGSGALRHPGAPGLPRFARGALFVGLLRFLWVPVAPSRGRGGAGRLCGWSEHVWVVFLGAVLGGPFLRSWLSAFRGHIGLRTGVGRWELFFQAPHSHLFYLAVGGSG